MLEFYDYRIFKFQFFFLFQEFRILEFSGFEIFELLNFRIF